MNRLNTLLTVFAVSVFFSVLPAFAQHGHAGGMGGGRGMMPPGGSMSAPAGPMRGDTRRGTLPTMQEKKTPDQLLNQNRKLTSRLQSLLPAGTNAQAAATGFKNLGQFVAAVHVSHNLGIPFDLLKAEMAGSGMKLGKAIHELKPEVSAKTEVKRAKKQAEADLKRSGSH